MGFYARYPNTPAPIGGATAANQVIEISKLTSIDDKTPALGQATSANSFPVVIASDQSPIVVSDTSTTAAVNDFAAKTAAGFVPEAFDETVLTYVGATTNIDTVTYKLAGTTVATLTLSYDGSSRLSGVVKS